MTDATATSIQPQLIFLHAVQITGSPNENWNSITSILGRNFLFFNKLLCQKIINFLSNTDTTRKSVIGMTVFIYNHILIFPQYSSPTVTLWKEYPLNILTHTHTLIRSKLNACKSFVEGDNWKHFKFIVTSYWNNVCVAL